MNTKSSSAFASWQEMHESSGKAVAVSRMAQADGRSRNKPMPTAMRAVLLNLELPKSDSIVPSLIEPLRVDK